jgi:hypothetical protein
LLVEHENFSITLEIRFIFSFRFIADNFDNQYWEAAETLQRENNYPYEMMPLLFALIKSVNGNCSYAHKLIQEGNNYERKNESERKTDEGKKCGPSLSPCNENGNEKVSEKYKRTIEKENPHDQFGHGTKFHSNHKRPRKSFYESGKKKEKVESCKEDPLDLRIRRFNNVKLSRFK